MENPFRITCEESFRCLGTAVDGELSDRDAVLLSRHLEACPRCAAEHAFEAAFLRAVRRHLRSIRAPESLRARVLAIVAEND